MGKKTWIALIILATILVIGGYVYSIIFLPNTGFSEDTKVLKIHTDESYVAILDSLESQHIVKNVKSFDLVAGWMNYKNGDKLKSGIYEFKQGMSNKDMVSLLRSGRQKPINLVINNVRTFADLCGAMSTQIELDSISLYQYFTNPENLSEWQLRKEDLFTLFIPNTYQVYWNISNEQLYDRMKKESDRFWNSDNRIEKLKANNLDKNQAVVLASIVEKESNLQSERPEIAGVYINRLNRGIPLQADPTVVFATGEYDLRRVLNKHLEVDSPYNTYMYAGLPPGPIYMPSINSIDAVVNADKNDYLYFCAKPGYGSAHAFAKNLSEHLRNAETYRAWLKTERIR